MTTIKTVTQLNISLIVLQDIRKHMSIFNRQIQLTKSVFSHNKINKLSMFRKQFERNEFQS